MRPGFSLQTSMVGGCLLVVVCTLIFVAVVTEHSLRGHTIDRLNNSLQRDLVLISELVREHWRPEQPLAQSDALAKRLGRLVGYRVTLISPQGKVVGDSNVPGLRVPAMENHASRPEVRQAWATGKGHSLRHSATLGLDLLYTARRLDAPGGKLMVRLALALEEVERIVSRTRRLVLGAVLLGVLLSVGVAYLVSRAISRPIKRLTQTAGAIADGDLSQRVLIYPRNEVGALGRAFDQMADKLQGKIQEISQSRDRLEAILAGMVEGVLVTDRQGQVILANGALSDMLQAPSPQGRHISAVMRAPELLQAVQEVRKGKGPVSCSVTIGGPPARYLEASVAPLSPEAPQAEVVAVLHDVSERRRADNVRRDFVANVSHELRTPLTAIRGSAETLLDGALQTPDFARRFVEMIKRHASRLEDLSQDILQLARLEAGSPEDEPQEVEAAELCDAVLGVMGEVAEQRSVELSRRLPPEPLVFSGHRLPLEEAIINLLDNAVKYSERGGKVRLAIERRDGAVVIEVSDKGVGIPPEHLPRIFERFYRVDKTRSRQMGGTGLGLAIVKHVAQLHSGRVEVDSQPGRGSTFRLILPG